MEPQKDISVQSVLKQKRGESFSLRVQDSIAPSQAREQGIVLFLSLIMLTSLTLIALTTFYNSVTQSKIATNITNIYEQNSADDIARMVATNWINNLFSPPKTSQLCNSTATCLACPSCIWQQGVISPKPSLQPASWWTAGNGNTNTVSSSNGIACTSQPPQYAIEQLSCDQTAQVASFRVTTQSMGSSSNYPVYREYIVTPYLKPVVVLMFNRSCQASSTVGYSSASNTFRPSTSGNITAIWIGNGCWSNYASFNITISGGTNGTYTQNNVTLPPAIMGCGGSAGGTSYLPMSNMSQFCLPTPYPVLTSQTINVTVSSNSGCGFHCVSSNPTSGTTCLFRMTVQGTQSDICSPAADAASVCP